MPFSPSMIRPPITAESASETANIRPTAESAVSAKAAYVVVAPSQTMR